MNKKDLICQVAERLRQEDIRKPVSAQKATFHITDDEGNTSDFTIRKPGRNAIYTTSDVAAILNTCLGLIEESIRNGEEVSLHGFGTFSVKHMAATTAVRPDNGEIVEIKAHYTPKFYSGKNLRLAAKVYDMSVSENQRDEGGVDHDGD